MSATYIDNDGVTQDCPNIDSNGELNKSWGSWVTTPNELKNNVDYNQKCYDICGPRNYIQTIGGNQYCDEISTACPIIQPRAADYDEQLSDLGEYANMCSVTEIGGESNENDEEPRLEWEGEQNVPEWFILQKGANLDGGLVGSLMGIDWSSSDVLQYWTQSERPLSDNEIRALTGGLRTNQFISETEVGYVNEADNGEFYYNYPEGYTDITTLRNDINESRGSTVRCDDSNRPIWMSECVGDNPATDTPPGLSSDSHFGPENIIYEEVLDFIQFKRREIIIFIYVR